MGEGRWEELGGVEGEETSSILCEKKNFFFFKHDEQNKLDSTRGMTAKVVFWSLCACAHM